MDGAIRCALLVICFTTGTGLPSCTVFPPGYAIIMKNILFLHFKIKNTSQVSATDKTVNTEPTWIVPHTRTSFSFLDTLTSIS